MRSNVVLIDFESVQPASLAALEHDHFKVLVFVGANQAKIPVAVATGLQRLGRNAEYIKISGNGKNALDFHIAYYIGQIAAREPSAFFHIISRDSGFDPLIEHLKSKKIFAARSSTIEEIPLVKFGNTKTVVERARLFAEKLQQPKVTRPRTVKTLASAIGHFYQKQLTEAEVTAVVSEMEKTGFVIITNGKVTYAVGAS